jgi:hypothetical protein
MQRRKEIPEPEIKIGPRELWSLDQASAMFRNAAAQPQRAVK